MRVFVTGHRGYIGAHVVDVLKRGGHEVTGCDLGLFRGCGWQPGEEPDRELTKDVRDITAVELAGHDCVMHLAAISNDPMGDLDPLLTQAVNRDGSIRLARIAKDAGIPRFLFASSCSVYGKVGEAPLDEHAPLNPLTEYARSKIEAEAGIHALADADFSPISLRSATAFGDSPMLRVDLVANNLLAAAHATGQIRIMSDGSPWRPLIHCRDIARSFSAILELSRDEVHDLAVNVGADDSNYRVREIAEAVKRVVPDADVVYTGEAGPDPRSYRVSFALFRRIAPDFRLEYSLESGLMELDESMRAHEFGSRDFESARFVRLRALQDRLHLLDRPATESAPSVA